MNKRIWIVIVVVIILVIIGFVAIRDNVKSPVNTPINNTDIEEDGERGVESQDTVGRLAAIECPSGSKGVDVCTEEYEPVCANGTTYSNMCFACMEPDVERYFSGSCDDFGDVSGPSGDPSDNTLLPSSDSEEDKEEDPL